MSFAVGLLTGLTVWAGSTRAAEPIEFDRQIAPLLAERCLSCHDGREKSGGLNLSSRQSAFDGGDSGAVLLAARPEESFLWQRIRDDEMPPKHPLSADEKALLKRWIAEGARWGTDPIDPFRFTTDKRAGYNWWSLQPLHRAAIPEWEGSPAHPIDAFVRRRLTEAELVPSPEADRRTLIRRLAFDLTGLPPTAEAVEAFVNDSAPDAYENLVERLLASEHYGERWARHWLDIARFGESQGFERDKLRPNSWRYRDWVIAALNADMPYDEFVRMQIAGDVLRPNDADGIAATGFLVAGAYDEVGQSQQSAAMRAVVRQDELEDYAATVGQGFLGLTVNCARCHDHKFDPISQTEYYAFVSALEGVRHGERPYQTETMRRELAALDARRSERKRQIAARLDPVRDRIVAERKQTLAAQQLPQPLARWTFDADFRDELGELHGTPHGAAKIDNGQLLLDGKSAYVTTRPLPKPLTEKTLEAWVRLSNLEQRGGGVVSVQTLDGVLFDAIVFGEKDSGQWLAGSNNFVRTQSFQGPKEGEADTQIVHVAIVYRADGTIVAYRNGERYGAEYRTDAAFRLEKDQSQVVFGLRHGTSAGGNRLLSGAIDQAQLYDRALSDEDVALSAGRHDLVTREQLLTRLTASERQELAAWESELESLDTQRQSLREAKAYAVVPKQPEVSRLLLRGNPGTPAEVIAPGGIASVSGVAADFDLAPDAIESERRRRLAEWITSPNNPLFARVIVNRLWHYHFGTGIVDSPNDFGFNGGRPTHPELLDFLAVQLVEHKFSLKALHRLIVTSETYRQSSRPRADALAVDADNRLLWRFAPQRLEAEVLRDAMLLASGELNPQYLGPPYQDFQTFTRNSQFYEMIDPVGPEFHRRTIYRTWLRSGRNMLLDAFDCPDPSTISPKRAVTTTPTQSLSLLNNSFVLRMSDSLAARAREDADASPAAQIAAVYRRVYQRLPSEDELARVTPFVEAHGLSALCRVLFNSNEFLYVE